MNYDLDELMGTYADWIAWLKEKEASLKGQLAKMKGKGESDVHGVENGERDALVEEVQSAAEESPSPVPTPSPQSTLEDDDSDDWL